MSRISLIESILLKWKQLPAAEQAVLFKVLKAEQQPARRKATSKKTSVASEAVTA